MFLKSAQIVSRTDFCIWKAGRLDVWGWAGGAGGGFQRGRLSRPSGRTFASTKPVASSTFLQTPRGLTQLLPLSVWPVLHDIQQNNSHRSTLNLLARWLKTLQWNQTNCRLKKFKILDLQKMLFGLAAPQNGLLCYFVSESNNYVFQNFLIQRF